MSISMSELEVTKSSTAPFGDLRWIPWHGNDLLPTNAFPNELRRPLSAGLQRACESRKRFSESRPWSATGTTTLFPGTDASSFQISTFEASSPSSRPRTSSANRTVPRGSTLAPLRPMRPSTAPNFCSRDSTVVPPNPRSGPRRSSYCEPDEVGLSEIVFGVNTSTKGQITRSQADPHRPMEKLKLEKKRNPFLHTKDSQKEMRGLRRQCSNKSSEWYIRHKIQDFHGNQVHRRLANDSSGRDFYEEQLYCSNSGHAIFSKRLQANLTEQPLTALLSSNRELQRSQDALRKASNAVRRGAMFEPDALGHMRGAF